MKRIHGVIFDLDGTLYSLNGRQLRMVMILWRDLGVLRHLSGARSWIRTQSFDNKEALFEAFYGELGRRARITPKKAEEWYETRFLDSFVKMLATKAKVRPGLLELLRSLRDDGVKLAVVSDFGRVSERLDALGIPSEAFDVLWAAEDLGVLKPSPKPLKALADKWGVEPGTVIVVGDREDLDAVCARAAGMEFLGVREGSRPVGTGREYVSWPTALRVLEARTSSGKEYLNESL
ncbi:MAG: HAD family hydrolase [Deltaproteobacteria bacterium]|nr:HAD family hydrolase [Deltaproteobacteria bacterium]